MKTGLKRMFSLCPAELYFSWVRGTLTRQVVASLAAARAFMPRFSQPTPSVPSIPDRKSSSPAQAGRKREKK
jgi:hypothetical protein